MTIRTRIFLVYLLLIGGGYLYLVLWILGGVRPRYLESLEESLVDTANILATIVENQPREAGADPLSGAALHRLLDTAWQRAPNAHVYGILKNDIDLRIYVTGADGIVRYDSDLGRDEGRDYSRWLDVSRTLRGEYGARATREHPEDDYSLAIHVAAPVRASVRSDGGTTGGASGGATGGAIIGVLTVSKPTRNINERVNAACNRVFLAGLAGGGLVIAVGIAFSVWITTPVRHLAAYARAVRDGRPASLPKRLAGREVSDLRRAFDEMRAALEGKHYVERYTQMLAHEIKAPLSAIRGAAELLAEDRGAMPAEQRARFLENIRRETARIQRIVEKLLQLAALEARANLAAPAPVDLHALVREVASAAEPARLAKGIVLEISGPASGGPSGRPSGGGPSGAGATVTGERFLLGQAIANLLQNAIEFTPGGGVIRIALSATGGRGCVEVTVEDTGPGIPDYALPQVFERFYSLPRPASGAKSTGLGLSFVREVAHLHGGDVFIENLAGPDGERRGCRATLRLAK
ncbi:MAG: two-component system sensor histidine kinase CreC [Opitutaceae bacterium]|nr:two-component system sensor histidine kinase CreC [Opitutaceae bacterium]